MSRSSSEFDRAVCGQLRQTEGLNAAFVADVLKARDPNEPCRYVKSTGVQPLVYDIPPLVYAASAGLPLILNEILEVPGVKIDAVDEEYRGSALCWACATDQPFSGTSRQTSIVRALLAAGANPQLMDKFGDSAESLVNSRAAASLANIAELRQLVTDALRKRGASSAGAAGGAASAGRKRRVRAGEDADVATVESEGSAAGSIGAGAGEAGSSGSTPKRGRAARKAASVAGTPAAAAAATTRASEGMAATAAKSAASAGKASASETSQCGAGAGSKSESGTGTAAAAAGGGGSAAAATGDLASLLRRVAQLEALQVAAAARDKKLLAAARKLKAAAAEFDAALDS